MSVGSLEETLEATVSPVQVNPFGNTQAQDHVILRPLSQKEIVILQNIIGLKEKRCGEQKYDLDRTNGFEKFSAKSVIR